MELGISTGLLTGTVTGTFLFLQLNGTLGSRVILSFFQKLSLSLEYFNFALPSFLLPKFSTEAFTGIFSSFGV